jgi:hypothetical protein
VKRLTLVRRSAAIRDSSSTAVRVWVSAWVVDSAAAETPVMLPAISVEPVAASWTDRDTVQQLVLAEETGQLDDAPIQRTAPIGQGVEAAGERFHVVVVVARFVKWKRW